MRKRHVKYSAYRYKAMYERVKQEMKASSRKYHLRKEHMQREHKWLLYKLDLCIKEYKPHYDEYIRLEVEKEVALYW
jgi:hypothetical protein